MSERTQRELTASMDPSRRIGVALVGLGTLTVNELLPALRLCRHAKLSALVGGDREKSERLAREYGLPSSQVYDYESFERLADDPSVDAVYLVLPNSLHAEFTTRAARAGKHVLCEKPMANTEAECLAMIEACRRAEKLLMIGYRLQYEPVTREVIRLARSGAIGRVRNMATTNTQIMKDPESWRLKRAMAGGGPLTDIGIYCINGARYLSGEEPIEVSAIMQKSEGDPRWREVEEQINFTLRFPSGFLATCASSYSVHDSRDFQLLGDRGLITLENGYSYRGMRMRVVRRQADGSEQVEQPALEEQNHFALQMDHFAWCVLNGQQPHTPGEEGLQDVRIIRAIYEAAESGRSVKLPKVEGSDPFRGPPPR